MTILEHEIGHGRRKDHQAESIEFMYHCSTKWATFLLSLKDLLENGEGRPTPMDLKIAIDG